jgi:hypothetical protein
MRKSELLWQRHLSGKGNELRFAVPQGASIQLYQYHMTALRYKLIAAALKIPTLASHARVFLES